MIKKTAFLAFLGCFAVTLVPGDAIAQENSASIVGDATRGKQFYEVYTCYGCHGFTGETGSGTRLNPPRLNQAGFIAYLRNPPNPTRMPPYQQAEVTDQNLADIYAFLVSLESGSPDAEDIDLLQEIIEELD